MRNHLLKIELSHGLEQLDPLQLSFEKLKSPVLEDFSEILDVCSIRYFMNGSCPLPHGAVSIFE